MYMYMYLGEVMYLYCTCTYMYNYNDRMYIVCDTGSPISLLKAVTVPNALKDDNTHGKCYNNIMYMYIICVC